MKKTIISALKILLLPISLLYGFIIFIRNKMYDWKLASSVGFDVPVISVGNITAGGTGKTPHIEYLIELFSSNYKVATLSRGYRRMTKGFKIADTHSTARTIGDEPFQFHSKYPQTIVSVAEERMTAIPSLLQLRPDVQLVLLDDAFQHRSVIADIHILLTDYKRLYTRDYILPFGLLRESKSGAKRAQIIVITKCPENMSLDEKKNLINEINPTQNQTVYFSYIQYKPLYPLSVNQTQINEQTNVLLVTGIANASYLINHLEKQFPFVHHLPFQDHHYFTINDIEEIIETFQNIDSQNKIIVTTEKDAARLMLFQDKILSSKLPFYAQPIGVQFLFDEQTSFQNQLIHLVEKYYPSIDDLEVDFELIQ